MEEKDKKDENVSRLFPRRKRMNAQEKVNAINRHPVGTKVVYWPILHKGGKRTRIRHQAYVDAAGQPVIFVDGVSGCVHTDHVEIGSLMDKDSSCFSTEFDHKW